MADDGVTNGGWRGMNGAQRRLALLIGAGFLVILAVIMVANATSMVSDFAAAGVPVTVAHVWLWEITSIIAWITEIPVIWWMVLRLRRSLLPYSAIGVIVAAATVPASAWHIGLMIAQRIPVYALEGSRYRFMVGVDNPLLYEYRKDVGTFLQFSAIALVAQWLIARAATVEAPPPPKTLAVNDGSVTHHLPVEEIDWVAAAGNYVEIAWRGQTLLHRATLSAVESELGEPFVRIHRGRIVRSTAIRKVETDRSGDFAVTLENGTSVRGSRRFRDAV